MNAVAKLPTDPISEANMEGLSLPGAGSAWSGIGFAVVSILSGIALAIGWWRKNNVSNAEASGYINLIADLRATLQAEREDHIAEITALRTAHAAEIAALREDNNLLRDRTDKFAAERNDWMMKWSEVSGQLIEMRRELDRVRGELQARDKNANPQD